MAADSGRPSTSCARRAQPEQPLEVDPGLDAHLVQHRDEVLGRDVARSRRAGTGQPPSSPNELSNESTPDSSAASTFASPWPRVLWKWAVSSAPGSSSRARSKNAAHLHRVRHAGRVAERDLLAAGLGEPPRDRRTRGRAARRPRTGSRTTPRSRPRSAAPHRAPCATTAPGPTSDSSIERFTFLRLCVSLADRNRFTSSNSKSPAERPLEPALVGDQHRVGDVGVALDRAQHLLGVGELRDHVGRARTTSPPAAAGPSATGSRSARPCPRSRSPRARSGSRREGRPRGCGPAAGSTPRSCQGRR